MKTITVFTPAYNRAYCIDQCYQSLLRQTNKAFIWLIIDDGSTDNTKELVKSWIDEGEIEIKYHYQNNQGMHGAHNAAYKLIDTVLNTCIDSDDFMPDNAIEKILDNWKTIENNKKFAGLVGLDAAKDGKIIGSKMPDGLNETTLTEIYDKHHVTGDKKLVLRTEIVKKYTPYPIFKGERFVPLGYLYKLIDQDYKLFPINEVLCIVEYLEDGSSRNMLKQYRRHPKGFAFSRKNRMLLASNFTEVFKNAIHYVSSSIFIKNAKFLQESPKKISTFFAIPFGVLLNVYIRLKTKNDF